MRGRQWAVRVASVVIILSGVTLGTVGTASAASTTTPACTFNGSSLPIVSGVKAGTKVAISCTGLSALHPYLLLQASLLIGIDPKAAALLSGGSLGIGTFEAALAALPEVDAASLTPVLSDLNGDLTETYTVPSFQPTDPNATCPPSKLEFDTGLVGCALAMVDLTTQKPVGAGSSVLEYTGDPFIPTATPSLVLSPKKAQPGDVVKVSESPTSTHYWWLATLASLEALLGGASAPPPVITVTFSGRDDSVSAANAVTVTPASYNGTTLTPPAISGTVTVPSGVTGKQEVQITYGDDLDGINLEIGAQVRLTV
jgi:hypothetical protein